MSGVSSTPQQTDSVLALPPATDRSSDEGDSRVWVMSHRPAKDAARRSQPPPARRTEPGAGARVELYTVDYQRDPCGERRITLNGYPVRVAPEWLKWSLPPSSEEIRRIRSAFANETAALVDHLALNPIRVVERQTGGRVEFQIVAGVLRYQYAIACELAALPIVVIRDERDLGRLVRDDSFVGPLLNAPASARHRVIQTIVDADANGRPLIAPATSGHAPIYRLTQKAVASALGIDGKTFRSIRAHCVASSGGPAPRRARGSRSSTPETLTIVPARAADASSAPNVATTSDLSVALGDRTSSAHPPHPVPSRPHQPRQAPRLPRATPGQPTTQIDLWPDDAARSDSSGTA